MTPDDASPVIRQGDVEAALRELGLVSGDTVMVHSALSSMGHVEGGADTVIDAFLAVLGESGTLVVPTAGNLGVMPDTLKARPDAVHSIHPAASVAAIGPAAEGLCKDHWKAELAHGPGTPYTRLAKLGGYLCLLGVDFDRATLLHTPETLLRLPYLKRTKEYTFDTPEGEVTKSWPFFPGPHRDFIGLDHVFRDSGKMRVGRIGRAVVRLIKAADLIEIAAECARSDPAFALCDNPHCAACVGQRADIRRDRFARESMTVAASAVLAGRYVEEIIDNCRRAGIGAVEFDGLRGRPPSMLGADTIREAVDELRSSGCEVTALRLAADTDSTGDLIDAAASSGISRLVLPLSDMAVDHATRATESGVAVSFFNVALGSRRVTDVLLDLKERGLGAGFTFNAANFARAGELPFLRSYKQGLKRFVDQLDIEDALHDGTPQPLARGNAEIKEMVSILRACSFRGPMVLGRGNRAIGDLADAVTRFDRLLDCV